MDIESIKESYINALNMPMKPTGVKPRIGTIIDEEKSVRWNREEVERQIAEYDAETQKVRQARKEAITDGLNHAKSADVWEWMISIMGSDAMYDHFIETMEDTLDLVQRVLA